MTREEAIKVLKKDLKIIDDPKVTMTAREWEEHDDHMRDALEMAIEALAQEPTAEYSSDVISRQAAVDAFDGVKVDEKTEYDIGYNDGIDLAVSKLSVLPSATSQNLTKPYKSDLIVKGAGEIKDGLYNIKDGKLFKYKANGGTVRTYPIVSADRPTGHWTEKEVFDNQDSEVIDCYQSARCSHCGKYHTTPYSYYFDNYNFCPNCGADMRGGEKE